MLARARDVRRLDPVRAVLDSDLELARAGRAVRSSTRPARRRPSSSIVAASRRRRRDLDRMGDLLAPLDGGAALRGRARTCSSTSSTSTSSTTSSSTGRRSRSSHAALARRSRRRSSAARSAQLAGGVRCARARHEPLQTGLVRTYVLAIAPASPSSPSSSWRFAMPSRLAHDALILIPIGAGVLIWLVPLHALRRGAARLPRRAGRGRRLGRHARALRLRSAGGSSSDAAGDLVQRPRRLLPRRLLRLLALARRPRGRRHGRARSATRSGSAASGTRAYFGLMLLLTGGDRRRLRRAGSPPLLRLLGGDADPALRPRRRVGRAGPAARDAQVRHLHDGGSLLMLAVDHRLRDPAGDVRPDRRAAPASSDLDLPRLRRRVRGQGAALPVPRLAAGRLPRGARRRWPPCSRASSRRRRRTAFLRIAIRKFPGPTARHADADPRARGDRARLRLAARVPRARLPRRRSPTRASRRWG